MDEQKRSKKIKEAITKLFSNDTLTIMKGLKDIKEDGDASAIKPMMDVYTTSDDKTIRNKVVSIISSLKTESAVEPLIDCLQDEKHEGDHAVILSGLWNSGMFPNEHIDTICQVAVKGDFMTAVEAVTVIENMEAPFEMESLQEATMIIADYVDEESEDDKFELIKSLQEILRNFEATVDF